MFSAVFRRSLQRESRKLLNSYSVPSAILPVLSCSRQFSVSPKKKALRALMKQKGLVTSRTDKVFKTFTVALVGRPNVGKSRLFNRLVKKNLAIVSDIPGTTRDWKESEAELGQLRMIVLDTGGLEDKPGGNSLESKMLQHTEMAIRYADVVLFLVDSRGVVGDDERDFVRWVKRVREGRPIHLVANKAERYLSGALNSDEEWQEFMKLCYPLGLGPPVPVSASLGDGMNNLYDVLEPYGTLSEEEARSSITTKQQLMTENSALLLQMRGALMGQQQPPGTPSSSSSTEMDGNVNLEKSEELAGSDVKINESLEVNLLKSSVSGPNESISSPSSDLTVPNSSNTSPELKRSVRDRLAREEQDIRIAIVGRPNVGKSTLLNQILGENRVMTGPLSGLTRDSVEVRFSHSGRDFRLVDTAGMRRWGSLALTTPLEGQAVGAAKKALEMSHVVVMVVDASGGNELGLTYDPQVFANPSKNPLARRFHDKPTGRVLSPTGKPVIPVDAPVPKPNTKFDLQTATYGLTVQDMTIINQVLEEGRALIVVLNKMDACPYPDEIMKNIRTQLDTTSAAKSVTLLPISALRGKGMEALMPTVLKTYEKWNFRIQTNKLNEWLSLIMRHHAPPTFKKNVGVSVINGQKVMKTVPIPLKIKYATQVSSRPPTFSFFANRAEFPNSYISYLRNSLREEFDLFGIPIRMNFRSANSKGKNP